MDTTAESHDLIHRSQHATSESQSVTLESHHTSSESRDTTLPFVHDFYIVRLSAKGRTYLLVVMLQPQAWEQINGNTIEGDMRTVQQSQVPVAITHREHRLVAVQYEQWKLRIANRQRSMP
jgi:hypothetical protein